MNWALVFALLSAGKSIPARIAMMAMTTSSSMRVKPEQFSVGLRMFLLPVMLKSLVFVVRPGRPFTHQREFDGEKVPEIFGVCLRCALRRLRRRHADFPIA